MRRFDSFFNSLLFLLLTIAGCQRPSPSPATVDSSNANATAIGSAGNRPVRVRTVSVQAEDLKQSTTQPATVVALHRTEVRSRVPGYLSDVKVDIGDMVKEGQTLAIVDVPEVVEQQAVLKAQIARHRAEEAKAKAGVDLVAAEVRAAEAGLKEAEAALQSVDAALAAAEAEFNRTADLVERRSLEPRLLDEARRKRDSQTARKAALQSAVASAQAGIGVAEAKQQAAVAELQAAEAATSVVEQRLNELDVQLQFATLQAPFSGIVTARQAEPGALVQVAEEDAPLFVISRVDRVRIRVSVPERDAAFVNRGDAMSVRFPSFPETEPLQVTVTRTSGSLAPDTRMMLIEAEADNADGRLLPGMFGEAVIGLNVKKDVAVLPARAVRFTDAGDAYVYTVSDGIVQVVQIATGADDGRTIEVLSGLNAGQTVIDAHLQRFTNGQQVEVLN